MLADIARISGSLLVLAATALPAAESGRMAVPSRHGVVASSHRLASEAGARVLGEGGNAIDAAVATAFALAVVHPSAGNVGGGGFLLFHGADGEVTSFDFRERAPLAAHERMYLDERGELRGDLNHEGLLAVGVPGTVAGLWLAHQRLGSLPWATLVAPALELAEDGFPSSWAMQPFLQSLAEAPEAFPSTSRAFLKEGRVPYEPGEIWRQPDLAATLRRIAAEGRDGFYRGRTAELLVDFVQRGGGLISARDLELYEAVERAPIHGTYRGYDVWGMPPPSSGGVAIVEMLNILEGFDLPAMGHNSALYVHVLAEAMRRAFADRAEFLGDPDFNPGMPVARLVSKPHAAALRDTIDRDRATPSDLERFNRVHGVGGATPESPSTTHFSVVDAAGNAVAVTYTLEATWGSRWVVEGAGFLLNNEMGDFNPVPGRTAEDGLIGTPPNLVAPGKRMLSSMSPTILSRGGRPVLVLGSPGGRMIINNVLQVVLNVVDHHMNLAEAVLAGRVHHAWFPDRVLAESGALSADTVERLEARGHRIELERPLWAVNAVWIDAATGLRHAMADPRDFDGAAVGQPPAPPAGTRLPDPLAAGWRGAPVCELLAEDSRQRTLRCTFPPGVGHERHVHAPHVGYTLSGGRMRITDAEGSREVEAVAGSSWTSGGVAWHEVLNVGETTAVYLIVEPK